jgi:hypothetical protein
MLGVSRRCGCAMAAEIATINRMGSASLREACEAVMRNSVSKSDASRVMTAVCERAVAIQSDMRYWDLVSIVQASAAASAKNNEELEILAELIRGKLSHLAPKHMIDVIASFESLDLRPKALYKDLFNRLIDSVGTSMYVDELVALLRVLARNQMKNEKLIDSLSSRIISNDGLINQLRILHCCEVVGAIAALGRTPDKLLQIVEDRVANELQVVPLDELWKTVTGFSKLVHSYEPFERMTTERMQSVISSLEPVMFDQVTSPIDFLQFIRLKDWMTPEIVIAACKWANDAVYRPATRTQAHRRPTIFEVALLADLCREMQIPMELIEKAVKVTVTSKGGTVTQVAKPKPLRYRKRRAYIREADGYWTSGVVAVKDPTKIDQPSVIKTSDAAFAPKLRAQSGDVPLWKSRSGPWFHRK